MFVHIWIYVHTSIGKKQQKHDLSAVKLLFIYHYYHNSVRLRTLSVLIYVSNSLRTMTKTTFRRGFDRHWNAMRKKKQNPKFLIQFVLGISISIIICKLFSTFNATVQQVCKTKYSQQFVKKKTLISCFPTNSLIKQSRIEFDINLVLIKKLLILYLYMYKRTKLLKRNSKASLSQ